MKRFILALVLLLISTPAFAAEITQGAYATGNLALSLPNSSTLSTPGFADVQLNYNTGFKIGGGMGYDFGSLRTEFEISYRNWDVENLIAGGDVNSMTYMVNTFYDFHIKDNDYLTPYIGGGIGIADLSADFNAVPKSGATTFAYQIRAGLGFMLSEGLSLDVSYQYLGTDDPDFDGVEATAEAHELMVGARYYF